MAKLYLNDTPKQKTGLGPSKETIAFLLNYSKALHITACQGIKYELFLN